MISLGRHDEVFIDWQEEFRIHIYKLIDYINLHEKDFSLKEESTFKLLEYKNFGDKDEEHIDAISEPRIHEPILLAEIEGEKRIIDGNHRLEKRHKATYEMTNVINISNEVIELFMEPYSMLQRIREGN